MNEAPLHVAVSGWLLGPPSGANRRLLALLQHLGERLDARERVTVLHARSFTPPLLPRIEWRAIAIPPQPTLRRVLGERLLLPRVLRELGATLLDHGFLPLPSVPVPTVLLVHDVRAVDGLTRWPRAVARGLLRRSCARAARVVVPSEWTKARLLALAPRLHDRVHVVPNGVELPSLDAPVPPQPSPANGYVLHTGHLERRKNLDVVIAALASFATARRPELWLAGADAGALGTWQRMAARLGVVLRAFGPVDDAALHALYSHAACVVLPSRHEGFGMTALEALAHGAPLVAAACTAIPEVVGSAGVLVAPDDVVGWQQALARAIDAEAHHDSERERRRGHAATHGWREAAERLLAAWRAAAHDARR